MLNSFKSCFKYTWYKNKNVQFGTLFYMGKLSLSSSFRAKFWEINPVSF